MSSVPAAPGARSLRSRTFAARWTDRYAVFVHGDAPPTNEEWGWVLDMWQKVHDPGSFRVLVYSRGAAPNAGQRAELNRVLKGARPRIALLTPSIIPRVAGKAFALFIPDFQVFGPDQLAAALDYLELGSDRSRAERTFAEVKEEFSGSANT